MAEAMASLPQCDDRRDFSRPARATLSGAAERREFQRRPPPGALVHGWSRPTNARKRPQHKCHMRAKAGKVAFCHDMLGGTIKLASGSL